MKRQPLRFLVSRKFWQRTAFSLACLATLIMAAYGIENYRGERAWARYRADAEARGAKLDFKDFIPPAIPDEENFAAIPIFRDLLSSDPAIQARAKKAFEFPRECISQYVESLTGRTMPDLTAVRDCLVKNSALPTGTDDAVTDVLHALEPYEPTLDQLRAAAARPRSRLDGEWEKGLDAAIWRLSGSMSIGKLVSLRVSALLAKGRAHEALIDWRVGHRHAGIFQGEPTLLACMLRVMLVSISTDTVRLGLPAHAWSEDDLNLIANDLASIDLMSDFTFGISSDRALQNNTLDLLKANPRMRTALLHGSNAKTPKWSWDMLIAAGWFAQNQVHLNEWYDQQIAGAVAAQDHSAIDTPPASFEVPKSWFRFPYWFIVQSATYMMGGNFDICRDVQTKVDLCLVACALERFRLRDGHYPKELRELVPNTLSKLPRDRFDGQALRYRHTDEGGAILYSVGKDCRDDGGDDAKDAVLRSTPVDTALPTR